MTHARAIRLELKSAAPSIGARLEALARGLRVGLRILHARVTSTGARYELELTGTERGVEKALRAIGGLA
jgi:hypothetical protein